MRPDHLTDVPRDVPRDRRHVLPHDVPGLALVRLAARLVPADRRADWVAEWAGELAFGWDEGRRGGESPPLLRLRLLARAFGTLPDAICLRRLHGASAVHSLDMDLRVAVRALRRRPGFVAVVVLTLALGIGATTALFSVVNGVLLRPLPVPEAERLVIVRGVGREGASEKVGGGQSWPDFADIRTAATSFDAMGALRSTDLAYVDGRAEPVNANTMFASDAVVRMLGLRSIVGRLPRPDEEQPGAASVAVLGHGFWQRRYGGDPSVVGRAIMLDGEQVQVVGVAAATTRLVGDPDVWRPLAPTPLDMYRGKHYFTILGRVRAGTTREAAEREVKAITRRLELAYPQDNALRSAELVPLREAVVGDSRPPLLVLFGAVTLVLLIGCANLASLFLARATSRAREMAVRAALGAPRGRLVRQWMVESALLTTTGALLGGVVAWLGTRALLAWVPRSVPRADEVGLDVPVLLFLVGVSAATGLVFGVLPALAQNAAAGGGVALGDGALRDRGTLGATPLKRRGRHLLVTGEVALATVLVVGALLLLKSFWRLNQADLHFSPDGLVVAQLKPPARYDSEPKILPFYARVREQVAAVPGVQEVSLAFEHPLSPGWTSSYTIEGEPAPAPGTEPESRVRPVLPGYFHTVGLRLLAGRDVADGDRFGTPGVVIVNMAFLRRHFPEAVAVPARVLGRRIHRSGWWPGQPESFEIVGVAADEPMDGVGVPAAPATYYAYTQFPLKEMWIVARLANGARAETIVPALRAAVARVDATVPVDGATTMRELLGESVAEPRFAAGLLSLFAGAALLLAAVGIYGVLAYGVAQRSAEIGVRMALGAGRARVVRQVVGEGLVVALGGVVLGIVISLAGGRVLMSLLRDVPPRDPAVLGGVVMLLVCVAAGAALLPALRASRVNPMTALRAE
jgi:putative ABC transport system permease protein